MPPTKLLISGISLATELITAGQILPGPHMPHLSDKVADYGDQCPRFMCNDPETETQSFSRYLSD